MNKYIFRWFYSSLCGKFSCYFINNDLYTLHLNRMLYWCCLIYIQQMNSKNMLLDWLFRLNVQLPSVDIVAFMETSDLSSFFSPFFYMVFLFNWHWRSVSKVCICFISNKNVVPKLLTFI